jgi:hypothetical protein
MPISQYSANALLNSLHQSVSYTPAAQYVALFTVMPSTTDTGATEVSGTSYARQVITFAASSARTSLSNALVSYPAAGSNWAPSSSPVIGVGLYDAITAGNLLESELLSTGSSSIVGSITSGSSSTTVVSGTPFAGIGTVLIDQEQISISITGTTMTFTTRGANSTTAASHSNGATVYALTPQTITTGNIFTIPSGSFSGYLI